MEFVTHAGRDFLFRACHIFAVFAVSIGRPETGCGRYGLARGDVVLFDAGLRRLRGALPAAIVAVGLATATAVAAPIALTSVLSPAQGTWRTQDGTEVTIAPCDKSLCGTLSWVVIPKKNADLCRMTDKAAFASLMMDYNNPDKTQQTRPILGLNMLQLTATADPTTFTARVYNPQDGSTNDVSVFILDNGNTLRIGGGCLGTICAVTQDWPKVPDRPGTPDFTCDGGQ